MDRLTIPSFIASVIVFILLNSIFLSRPVGGVKPSSRKPNIILILTDDQDKELGSLKFMPKLRKYLTNEGVEFENAYVTTPMCCPSRSSMLTGLYSHNHNVFTNHDNCSSFAWRQQYEHRMFAPILQRNGYRTAYLGKYLNEYNGSYVPMGWDEWIGLLYNSKYYNYTLNVNGVRQSHGSDYAKDYLPDVIVNDSIRILNKQRVQNPEQPLLMVLSFPSPHGKEDSAPQYQTLFGDDSVKTHHTPAWNFAPNPDKEWLLQHTQKMVPIYQKFTDILHRKRLQTLQSVDDGVEKLLKQLEYLDMLKDTYIIFTSDHGYHLGQFGLIKGKSLPYEFDTKVPFIIRGPEVGKNTRVHNIVLNIDLAPTILDLAGVGRNETPVMDGRSIVKLLNLSRLAADPENKPRTENNTAEVRLAKAWRESFLLERGKLTVRIAKLRDNLEASMNQIVSKRARLDEECRQKQFRWPCQPGQKWYCWPREDDTGVRKLKCRAFLANMKSRLNRRHLCVCPKVKQREDAREPTKLSEQTAFISSASKFELWNNPVLRNFSSANLSQRCHYNWLLQRVKCSPYQSKRAWARDNHAVDRVITILRRYMDAYVELRRVIRRSKPLVRGLCECPLSPMQYPTLEGLKAVQYRMRRPRRNRRNRRRRRRRKKTKSKYCNKKNMNCFVHTRDHWKTPPFWKYRDICFCGNSNNNTYWCVRTINATHNTLYCEFVTGFISFFDLKTDPYQLHNLARKLPYSTREQLHIILNRLRRCRGPRQCTVRLNARHGRRRRRRLRHRMLWARRAA